MAMVSVSKGFCRVSLFFCLTFSVFYYNKKVFVKKTIKIKHSLLNIYIYLKLTVTIKWQTISVKILFRRHLLTILKSTYFFLNYFLIFLGVSLKYNHFQFKNKFLTKCLTETLSNSQFLAKQLSKVHFFCWIIMDVMVTSFLTLLYLHRAFLHNVGRTR